MRFKSKTLAGFIIILLALAMILPVSAFDDDQTRHIELTDKPGADADTFVTETGIGFQSELVTITDPNMDIYAYLFFEDMKINYWHSLINATLRLRTASSMAFDADSSVTIYGVDDYIGFGSGTKGFGPFGAPSDIMNAPLTSAYVNLNTSQFYGPQWWEIDVTNIVQELKSNIHWDGPGYVQADPGDNMGFIILGEGGHDTRFFYDLKAGNGYEAQLHLHWTSTPSPPEGYPTAIFNQSYGNYTIWKILGGLGYPLDPMEYIFTEGTGSPYDVMYDNITVPDTPISVATSGYEFATGTYVRRGIVRMSNGTIFVVYLDDSPNFQVYIKQSDDEGENWKDETLISTYTGMGDSWQYSSSIAIDSNDNLHVVWAGEADGFANKQIWYALYDGSWHTPVRISTYANMATQSQGWPAIAVDSYDDLHVVWNGKATGFLGGSQMWYSNFTTGWSAPLRISTYAGMHLYSQNIASMGIDSQNHIHVAFYGKADGFTTHYQIWYALYDGSWHTPVRISTYANMATQHQYRTSLAVDSADNIHIVWDGYVDWTVNPQILYVKYIDSWVTPIIISNYTGMNLYPQGYTSIAVDTEDYLHVLFEGKATGYTDFNKIWYANYTDSWAIPECIQPTGQNIRPSLRWSRWPVGEPSTYIVADLNGTVLIEGLDTLEDAQDWIDTYDPDPDDPDPPGWEETGPFTRFKTRLYIFLMGFGMIWGPLMVFAYRRPTGYAFVIGLFVMLIGLGFLIHAGTV